MRRLQAARGAVLGAWLSTSQQVRQGVCECGLVHDSLALLSMDCVLLSLSTLMFLPFFTTDNCLLVALVAAPRVSCLQPLATAPSPCSPPKQQQQVPSRPWPLQTSQRPCCQQEHRAAAPAAPHQSLLALCRGLWDGQEGCTAGRAAA